MADSDNAVIGYTFFEPDTGIARYVRLIFLPFTRVWETPPTQNDVSGIDKSKDWLPKIPFDLSAPEDMHRARLVKYVRDTLGRDISAYVDKLPEGALSNYLYNVAYNRPMSVGVLRLRINDTLVNNAYAVAPYYMTMWLLRAFAAELNDLPMNSMKAQGKLLTNLADHLQFAIDHILVNSNLSEPNQGIIIEAYTIGKQENGALVSKNSTVYVDETIYTEWLEQGGSPELFVAEWGLNGRIPDATTITNKQQILTAWEAAQTPPSVTS